MTVKDMIEELNKFPEDMEVFVIEPDGWGTLREPCNFNINQYERDLDPKTYLPYKKPALEISIA